MTLPFSASNYASCQVLEGERADARDDVFSLACIAYLLLSGSHPFPKRTAIEAREAKLRIRRPGNVSNRQWRALRGALRWERENRPHDVQQWLSELELGRAAKKLAPINDLLEPPAVGESRSWLGAAIAVGAAVLLFGVYWFITHRAMLPSIESTASTAPAPTTPAPSSATSTAAAPTAASAPNTPAANNSPQDNHSPPANNTRPGNNARPADNAPTVAAAPQNSASASHKATTAAAPIASAATPATAMSRNASPPRSSSPAAAPAVKPAEVAPAAKAPTGTSKLELAADTVDVPAGQPSAQVTVHRKGSLRGETSFTWWTESGTAKPGADFSAVSPQLAYVPDGKSTVSLSIPLSIAPHTQSKSFYVVIDQSDGGAPLGARTLTMVTLLPSN